MNEHFYPMLDETLFRETLPNGLQIAVVPKKGFARSVACLVTDFGSVHRSFTLDGVLHHIPAGVAHFLEHKMFELPGEGDVTGQFASLGANVNAFTSYDMTAYYFSCTDHFEEALHLLLKFVSTPCFPAESVEREIPIIQQEIDMNLDTPDSVLFDELMEAVYSAHPVRDPILGTGESIREITPEILSLCHRAFYHPANMLLCVMADVEPETVVRIAQEGLAPVSSPAGQKLPFPPERPEVNRAQVVRTMEVAMPTFTLAFKCLPAEKGAAAVRQEIVADLAAEALFGESSPLYLRLYEQGLIDSSFGGGLETLDGCAMLCAGGDSDDPLAVRDAIMDEAARLCREGLAEKDFLRMKRSALGRRIRGLDSLDGTAFRICACWFSGFDYFCFPEVYQNVTLAEILEFLRQTVRRELCAISIIEPEDKEERP